MDVDGGTTPACMLLEPVGRTLADRLSHMAAEPLAPQEQVCILSRAAVQQCSKHLCRCTNEPPVDTFGLHELLCSWAQMPIMMYPG